jgi:hypothetical protein
MWTGPSFLRPLYTCTYMYMYVQLIRDLFWDCDAEFHDELAMHDEAV